MIKNMAYTFKEDNFKQFQVNFKKETGLDANSNMAQYISYYNGKMADYGQQTSAFLLQEVAGLRQDLINVIKGLQK